MKKLWKWTRRILLACVVLVLLVAVTSAIWHSFVTRRTERKYPMPGRLIDVGTHKLHCDVEGKGPIVVLENGVLGASWEMEGFQDQLAEFATVCTYDRAGLGWSECGPLPRTPQRIVEELRCMLKGADLDPPYILVGGSLGGYYMRLYACKYPEEVSGLLLLDAVNLDKFPEDWDFPGPKAIGWTKKMALTADLGVVRWVFPSLIRKSPAYSGRPDEFFDQWVDMKSRSKVIRTLHHEALGLSDWLTVRDEMVHLGEMPVTVVSSTEPFMGWDWWIPAQKALASISNDIRVLELENAHGAGSDDPNFNADAMRDLINRVEVRKGSSVMTEEETHFQ